MQFLDFDCPLFEQRLHKELSSARLERDRSGRSICFGVVPASASCGMDSARLTFVGKSAPKEDDRLSELGIRRAYTEVRRSAMALNGAFFNAQRMVL